MVGVSSNFNSHWSYNTTGMQNTCAPSYLKREKLKTSCILVAKVGIVAGTVFFFLNVALKCAYKAIEFFQIKKLPLMGLSFMGGSIGMGLSSLAAVVFAFNQTSCMVKNTNQNLKDTCYYLLKNGTCGTVMGAVGFAILPMIVGAVLIGFIYKSSKSSFNED